MGCTLFLGHEETTTSQALYPTSLAILASFDQTRTALPTLLAQVPNPNVSSSFQLHFLVSSVLVSST